MRRGLVFVLLLMTFVSQCLALAGRADALGQVKGESSHTMLHWKGEAHHHLDDGSLRVDASHESTQHLIVDCVLTAPTVLPSLLTALPRVVGVRPLSTGEPPTPEPNLPGIKRPPRLAA